MNQKGFSPVLIVIGMVILLVLIGGYFLSKRDQMTSVNDQANLPLKTPSYAPTAVPSSIPSAEGTLSQNDIESIKQAVAQTSGEPISQLNVTFAEDNNLYGGLYAKGGVGSASGEGGGAGWFAAKVNGVWEIAGITQSGLFCDDIDKYNFPRDLMPSCLDKDRNLITR